MSEKVKNLLLQLNIEILYYFTEHEKIIFLLCLHTNGNLFFINIKSYDVSLNSDSDIHLRKKIFMQRINSQYLESYTTNDIYQLFYTLFPQYINKLSFIIDNYLLLNTDTAYKIIQGNEFSSLYLIIPKFDLDFIITSKYKFEEQILIFNDDIHRKCESFSSDINISNLTLPEVNLYNFQNFSKTISCEREELSKLQSLYFSMVQFESSLRQNIKKLEDYTLVKTLVDSKNQMIKKVQTKKRLNQLMKLKTSTIENLTTLFLGLNHKIILFLYYSKSFSKLYLSINNVIIDFEKKRNLLF